jgi:hypothetical protein
VLVEGVLHLIGRSARRRRARTRHNPAARLASPCCKGAVLAPDQFSGHRVLGVGHWEDFLCGPARALRLKIYLKVCNCAQSCGSGTEYRLTTPQCGPALNEAGLLFWGRGILVRHRLRTRCPCQNLWVVFDVKQIKITLAGHYTL